MRFLSVLAITLLFYTASAQEISVSAKLLTVYQLVAQEDYEKALAEIKEVLSVDSSEYNAYIFGGICYKNLESCDSAVHLFDKAIEIKPEQADPYFLKAECSFELRNFEESLKLIDKTLYYDNDFHKARILKARVKHEQGDFLSAEKILLQVMKDQLYNIESRKLMAEIYLELADTSLALNCISQALLIDPQEKESLEMRIGILENLDLHNALVQDVNTYSELYEAKAEYFFHRGLAHLKLADTISALRDFNDVIYKDEDYIKAYYYRAITRNALYDKEGACEDLKKAAAEDYLPEPDLIDRFCGGEEGEDDKMIDQGDSDTLNEQSGK